MEGTKLEFSKVLPLEVIDKKPYRLSLEANEEERSALAKRLDLLEMASLKAEVVLNRQGGGLIHIVGSFSSDIVQKCVVTLEPVPNHVEDEFETYMAPITSKFFKDINMDELDIDVLLQDEKDFPEPIENEEIDVAELVTQYLSLAMDPYPRKEGVEVEIECSDEEQDNNPFSALKGLKSEE